jgi:hypothetical protein
VNKMIISLAYTYQCKSEVASYFIDESDGIFSNSSPINNLATDILYFKKLSILKFTYIE